VSGGGTHQLPVAEFFFFLLLLKQPLPLRLPLVPQVVTQHFNSVAVGRRRGTTLNCALDLSRTSEQRAHLWEWGEEHELLTKTMGSSLQSAITLTASVTF